MWFDVAIVGQVADPAIIAVAETRAGRPFLGRDATDAPLSPLHKGLAVAFEELVHPWPPSRRHDDPAGMGELPSVKTRTLA